MHEVAVTSPCTSVLLILTACGLAEISDRRELDHDGPPGIEATLQAGERLGSTLLIPELDIHTANHVICQIVADVQVLNLAMLGQLLKNIFVKVLEQGIKNSAPMQADAGQQISC